MGIQYKSTICSDLYNKINKGVINSMAEDQWKDIKAWEVVNDLTCEFIVSDFVFGHNYLLVSWDNFQKAYYVIKRSPMPGGMIKLTCEIDVLTTYADEINRAPAVLERTSNSAFVNFFQRDEKIPVLSTTDISTKNFGNVILGENPKEYIYAGIWLTRSSSEVEEGD